MLTLIIETPRQGQGKAMVATEGSVQAFNESEAKSERSTKAKPR